MNTQTMPTNKPERGSFSQALRKFAEALRACCAACSGSAALDALTIPREVADVSPRSRRLVRQAQISPW